ncbi:MAG: hypothetical protein LQ341_002581 [Variospora aurantia]|nr:MAG: hypothetical protein LQ341_002581 [Variospora aurantia]
MAAKRWLFDSLPPELKSSILGFVGPSTQDWKSARLVCRDLTAINAPYLFEELWLMPYTALRLEDKSIFQAIRSHVKHLVLYADILPSLPLHEWEAVKRREHLIHETRSPLHDVKDQHAHYCPLYRRQSKFIKKFDPSGEFNNQEFSAIIIKTLQSFPNLKKVTVGDCCGCVNRKILGLRPVFPRTRILEAFQLHSPEIRDLFLSNPTYFAIDVILMAISSMSGTGISCLNAHMLSTHYANPKTMLETSRKTLLAGSLRNITSMNLELVYDHVLVDRAKPLEASVKLLSEILSAAAGLQELVLAAWAGTREYGFTFMDFLAHDSLSTTSLKKLRLIGIDASKHSLRTVLLQQRKTLRSLGLDSICLLDVEGTSWHQGWPGMLHMTATDLNLQDIALRSLMHTPCAKEFFAPGRQNKSSQYPHESMSMNAWEESVVEGIIAGRDIEEACKHLWDH